MVRQVLEAGARKSYANMYGKYKTFQGTDVLGPLASYVALGVQIKVIFVRNDLLKEEFHVE